VSPAVSNLTPSSGVEFQNADIPELSVNVSVQPFRISSEPTVRNKTKLNLSEHKNIEMNPKNTESPNEAAGSSPTIVSAVLIHSGKEEKVPRVIADNIGHDVRKLSE